MGVAVPEGVRVVGSQGFGKGHRYNSAINTVGSLEKGLDWSDGISLRRSLSAAP